MGQKMSIAAVGQTTSVVCDFQVTAVSGDTCASMAAFWGLSQADFQALNPSVSCPGDLVAGQEYCVLGTVTTTTSTATPTTVTVTTSTPTTVTPTTTPTTVTVTTSTSTRPSTTLITSTTTSPSSTTPSPLMPSLASDCNKFHQVQSGDACASIEQSAGITDDEFRSWNPTIDAACDNLWLGYYVCVGVPGATGPSTPSPLMPNTTSDCNKYYQIQSGDSCQAIEQSQGISDSNFKSWNPSIDAACDNLWLGYYVCVGAPGATGPSTPSPLMPNTTSDCNKYYQVKSGDSCQSIEQSQGVSDSNFKSWNPSIDAACDNLWLGYYVCVGAPGATGPSTPSPLMPNTVSNCKKFYQVKSGDTCAGIEKSAGVSDSSFKSWNPHVDAACDNLWLGYYVCVGV
ncbi:carbohydrate-binding module family 50 protein [Thermothielavioides terrestris NRRL 8126]|uniref:Carbohydrate-binding module family 50 protein n=1 Tax=Thermothielavioides terrestris (strain ATCC 38088 / NRRL 8126) TaxID=578455 RepID=G2RCC8_THETT|nr:carbohydrate-binding module family 50 protein [Thermothielavioides terrestris NRRL 8126]AEO70563.1 carbohydrate-binding module family 50 protein [Thermothielavioides terrestris NRRL 8126]